MVKHLGEDGRQQADFSQEHKRTREETLSGIFEVVEKEMTSMTGRQWELGKRSDGRPTVLRDVLGNSWIDKVKEVGDTVVK